MVAALIALFEGQPEDYADELAALYTDDHLDSLLARYTDEARPLRNLVIPCDVCSGLRSLIDTLIDQDLLELPEGDDLEFIKIGDLVLIVCRVSTHAIINTKRHQKTPGSSIIET